MDYKTVLEDIEIATLVRYIQRRYRIWVGLIDAHGIFPAKAEHFSIKLCEREMSNSGGACRGSLRKLYEEGKRGASHPPNLQCHRGLRVRFLQREKFALYASGFLLLEDVASQRTLSEYVQKSEDFLDEEREAVLMGIAKLSRTDVNHMMEILAEIAILIDEKISTRRNDIRDSDRLGAIIGRSAVMVTLFEKIEAVARTQSTVLVRGENGTGKDLTAIEIHKRSERHEARFVARNCAAIPADLIESEFFGHKKGAFSGAHKDRLGLFDIADKGTLFLDEIGDMSFELQTKLLRVVETGTFIPVGGGSIHKVNVRLIFATHRDLKKMVEEGTFREDLYYRIKVLELHVPPLRERGEDILLLARFFLKRAVQKGYPKKALSADASAYLMTRAWNGNVRQLENALERALIFSGENEVLHAEDFAGQLREKASHVFALDRTMPEQIETLERELILAALKKHGWNKTHAAKTLGISRRNLIRKVSTFGLESEPGPDR